MKDNNNHNGNHRVIAFLDRDEVDYIDRIGKDALFTSGSKLSRVKIIKAAVDTIIQLGVSGKKIGSVKEFEKEILRKMDEFISHKHSEEIQFKNKVS